MIERKKLTKLVRAAIRRLVEAREEEPGRPMFDYAYVLSETSDGERTRPPRPWNWDPRGTGQEMRPRHHQPVGGLGIEPAEERVRIELVLSPEEQVAVVAKQGRSLERAAAELGITERQLRRRIEGAHRKLLDAAVRALEGTR